MEFTLENTADMLKETWMERVKQIETLVNKMSVLDPSSFKEDSTSDEVGKRQSKMYYCLWKEVVQEESKDYPIPRTLDLEVEVMKELKEQVRRSKDLRESLKKRLSSIQEDISYLQNKKTGLEKMKQAYLEHDELTSNTTYSTEHIITSRIFRAVKTDLDDVVQILFPDNQDIRNFISALTTSYIKGGDDVYVDITPEVVDFANFLIEADIAACHRNDKKKIRLIDMI